MNSYLRSTLDVLKENMGINEEEEQVEEASNNTSAYAGGEGPQRTPNVFDDSDDDEWTKSYKGDSVYHEPAKKTNKWKEERNRHFLKMVEEVTRIDEGSYINYRQEANEQPKQKINTTIKEVDKRIREIEKMLGHTLKYKNEIQANDSIFYKDTIKKFNRIQDRIGRLGTKIREFGV